MSESTQHEADHEAADRTPTSKQELMCHDADRPATVETLRRWLANTGELFDRGKRLVQLQRDAQGSLICHELNYNEVIRLTHLQLQPMKYDGRRKRGLKPITLPDQVARAYLDLGTWGVPPLAGITTAPILRADGSIVTAAGYDAETQVYCDAPPDIDVPDNPTMEDAQASLARLRRVFATFPFADADIVGGSRPALVDLTKPPGLDESSFLNALLTAVCRSSLRLAPGYLITAPGMSGSGSGKGLLFRCAIMVGYGIRAHALPSGHNADEMDKRLVAALIEGKPVVMLDNLNSQTLGSDTLNSVLTERPATLRILGKSQLPEINTAAFIGVTGNGLTVTEDTARRFLHTRLDPHMEDPEDRKFGGDLLSDIQQQRPELLSAALTIWRWGRQNAATLKSGRALGSFEYWSAWVRDPLLTLGCQDPTDAMKQAKRNDPRRRQIAELFETWWHCHCDDPVKLADLHQDVIDIIDPKDQGRQHRATVLGDLEDTRHGGYVFRVHRTASNWGRNSYVLDRIEEQETGEAAEPDVPHSAHTPYGTYDSSHLNAGENVKSNIYGDASGQGHRDHRGSGADAKHARPPDADQRSGSDQPHAGAVDAQPVDEQHAANPDADGGWELLHVRERFRDGRYLRFRAAAYSRRVQMYKDRGEWDDDASPDDASPANDADAPDSATDDNQRSAAS